jgi:putative ATP-dependent DNA ligase
MQTIIREGLEKGKVEKLSGEIDYYRFAVPFRKVERGTVVAGKRVIWGFPHIKRIFTLEKGIEKNIRDSIVHAEEKIDGFNCRIARVGKKIYGFSRGGFLDSFISEKAGGMGLEKFFERHPGHVLCGEMVGNTPYTEPEKKFDVKLFIFDIDRGDGSYLPPEEKYEALRHFKIPGVPVLGKFRCDDFAGLKKAARALNSGKKEGMVIKSDDRRQVVKYVTPFADIDDILNTSDRFLDMSMGFYYQRILRSSFFIRDFGLGREKHASALGKAFYSGMIAAIDKVSSGGQIDREFEILVKDAKIWDEIKGHRSKEIGYEKLWEKKEKGKTRIRFRKIYWKTTRELASLASGKGVTD